LEDHKYKTTPYACSGFHFTNLETIGKSKNRFWHE